MPNERLVVKRMPEIKVALKPTVAKIQTLNERVESLEKEVGILKGTIRRNRVEDLKRVGRVEKKVAVGERTILKTKTDITNLGIYDAKVNTNLANLSKQIGTIILTNIDPQHKLMRKYVNSAIGYGVTSKPPDLKMAVKYLAWACYKF